MNEKGKNTSTIPHLVVIHLFKLFSQNLKHFEKKLHQYAHHSHFGKVEKPVICEVRCTFFNEGEIREVHTKVWDTWGITAVQGIPQVSESSI